MGAYGFPRILILYFCPQTKFKLNVFLVGCPTKSMSKTNEDGYITLAALCCREGWWAYQLRPKLHMMAHIVFLDRLYMCFLSFPYERYFIGVLRCVRSFWNDSTSYSLRLDLQWELENEQVEYILSPSVSCTWADEDYIGKVARVSRRTHPWTAAMNTIQRTLGFYRRVWGEKFNKSYFLEGET